MKWEEIKMAFDGALLKCVKSELEENLMDSKVDKIHQPSKDELIITFRSRSGNYKLLISIKANSSRIHLTNKPIENPKVPPMICMLLRKKLAGAKLINIRQKGLERVLFFDFDTVNDIFEKQRLVLIVEIMGKYSNVILADKNYNIIDALRRVNEDMSSKRQVLPGVKYTLPPSQGKLNILNEQVANIAQKITESKLESISKAVSHVIQGLSSVVCDEIEFLNSISKSKNPLEETLSTLKRHINSKLHAGYMVTSPSGKMIDFTFIPVKHFEESGYIVKKFDTISEMLDAFYYEKDSYDRVKSKNQFLFKHLHNLSTKLNKKLKILNKELMQSHDKEKFKVQADILNANIYKIEKGLTQIELENFYDEEHKKVQINLDPSLSPIDNVQQYYKKYKKAKNAEKILAEQIEKTADELQYINTVLFELENVQNEQELNEIHTELVNEGYLKNKDKNSKIKNKNTCKFLKFKTDDGYEILVGKNNVQNDQLTLKKAKNCDIWFHVKDCPGSHTVLISNQEQVPDSSLVQAAVIAAFYSKAKNSAQVPVDFTAIKNVKKPNGAKPGMVIYENYKTLYVTPTCEMIDKLKQEN